jgi:hypothetical protein
MYESPYGTRRVCFACETAFFDLKKEQVICPKCGQDQSKKPKLIYATSKSKTIEVAKIDLSPMDDANDDLAGELESESYEQLAEAGNMDPDEEAY